MKEVYLMFDSEKKIKWQKENLYMVSIKFHRRNDADLVAFLDSKGSEKNSFIKKALNEYLTNHPEEKVKEG